MKERKINSELKRELKNKVILVTGGSGSIGSSIVKELLKDDCNDAKIDKITQLDERYANQLNEAAIYKRKMKQVTESFKQDVYSAKHGTDISKMRSLKANIKKII